MERQIEGWVATSESGLILGSFRIDPTEADIAARRALRLMGGQTLMAGYRLVRATLLVAEHEEQEQEQC